MKLAKEIEDCMMLPPWYGAAWRRMDRRTIVCYPIPLNVVFAWARGFAIWVRHGGRSVPANARDAYAQGLRDAKHAPPNG